MRKLFKKSLALIVAIALSLTVFVGAFTAEAATNTGTIVVSSAQSTTTNVPVVDITITKTGTSNNYGVVSFNLVYPTGLTLTEITSEADVSISWKSVVNTNTPNPNVSGTTNSLPVIVMDADSDNSLEGFSAVTLSCAFTASSADATAAGTTHTITVSDVQGCDYGDKTDNGDGSYTYDESTPFDMDITAGSVKFIAPSDATFTATASDVFKNTLRFGVNYSAISFTGNMADVTELGILAIRTSRLGGAALTVDTVGAIKVTAVDPTTTTASALLFGMNFLNLAEDYTFRLYIKVNDSVGTRYTVPYVANYAEMLKVKVSSTNATTNRNANHYVNAYYTLFGIDITGSATALSAPANVGSYTANYTKNTYTLPAASGVTYTTSDYVKFNTLSFGYNFSNIAYSGSGTVNYTGVLMLRADKYANDGSQITRETTGVIDSKASDTGLKTTYSTAVTGLGLTSLTAVYIFVPYVELTDGTMAYGACSTISFADYLVSRMNKASTAARANALLTAYEYAVGTKLYQ